MEALVSDLRRLKQHYEGLNEPPLETLVKLVQRVLSISPPPRGYSQWRTEQRAMEDICRLQGYLDGSPKLRKKHNGKDGEGSSSLGLKEWQVVEDHFSTSSSGSSSVFAGSSSGSCSSFFNSSSSSSNERSSKGSRSSLLTSAFQRYAPSEASESGKPMDVKSSRPKVASAAAADVVVDALEKLSRQVNADEKKELLERLSIGVRSHESRRSSQRNELVSVLDSLMNEVEFQQLMLDNMISENTRQSQMLSRSLRASEETERQQMKDIPTRGSKTEEDDIMTRGLKSTDIPTRGSNAEDVEKTLTVSGENDRAEEGDRMIASGENDRTEESDRMEALTAEVRQLMNVQSLWMNVQEAKTSMLKYGALALFQTIALCVALASIFYEPSGRVVPT